MKPVLDNSPEAIGQTLSDTEFCQKDGQQCKVDMRVFFVMQELLQEAARVCFPFPFLLSHIRWFLHTSAKHNCCVSCSQRDVTFSVPCKCVHLSVTVLEAEADL